VSEEYFTRLKRIIAAQLGIDELEITEDSHLQDDLNADPISIADLIVEIEEEFKIKIPQNQAADFNTVGDILSFILDQTGDL